MLNSKGPAATSELHIQQLPKAPQILGQTSSETGSEMGNNSDHSSGYSSRSAKALQAIPNIPNAIRYPSPSQLQHPMSIITSGYAAQNLGLENGYMPGQHQDEHLSNPGRTTGNETVKAFACTTCSKGFARRSDLARHGRQLSPRTRPSDANAVEQNESTVESGLTCVTIPAAKNSSSSDQL